jgi:saccharopine dehydrogenase-like NADP-dependent oxidoreductase
LQYSLFVRQNGSKMLPHAREAADLGLSFVIWAGWMPGISELVPAYTNAQARSKMDAIESVTVYLGDSDEWSVNALRYAQIVYRERRDYRINGLDAVDPIAFMAELKKAGVGQTESFRPS